MATTSLPSSIVENEYFLDYIAELDKRHSVPTRPTAVTDIRGLCKRGKKILKQMLGNYFTSYRRGYCKFCQSSSARVEYFCKFISVAVTDNGSSMILKTKVVITIK